MFGSRSGKKRGGLARFLPSRVPVRGNDIDTDRIIPARFLRCVTFDGLGEHAFADDRRQLQDADRLHPFDDPAYVGATVLVVGSNFGCGSSREHAPWALGQYGFRVVIAPSFADIFFNNCYKNGLLPIVLTEQQVDHLFNETLAFNGYQLTIDLETQEVIAPDNRRYSFEIDGFRKYCLLNGLDDIGLTLKNADKIKAYEAERVLRMPWLATQLP